MLLHFVFPVNLNPTPQGYFTGTGAMNCPSANEVTLQDMSKCSTSIYWKLSYNHNLTSTQQCAYSIECICMFAFMLWQKDKKHKPNTSNVQNMHMSWLNYTYMSNTELFSLVCFIMAQHRCRMRKKEHVFEHNIVHNLNMMQLIFIKNSNNSNCCNTLIENVKTMSM